MAVERASIELKIAAAMDNGGRRIGEMERKERLTLTGTFAPDERSLTISR
jgi:hypothetical protein